MAFQIGELFGAAMGLLLVLVIVLLIGKIPALRKYPLGLHFVGVALVWIIAAPSHVPAAAYLVTLVAVWNYRREVKKLTSGWYRVGAGLTAIWLVLGAFLLNASYSGEPTDPATVLLFTWVFVVLGMAPWLFGWLVQWIREGFKAKPDNTSPVA